MRFNDLELIFLIYLSFINIIAFLVMGADKSKAKNKRYRTSENIFIILGVIGGAVGVLIGMTMFRHKTNKKKFYIGVPIIYIISQIIIVLVFNYIK